MSVRTGKEKWWCVKAGGHKCRRIFKKAADLGVKGATLKRFDMDMSYGWGIQCKT
jgi:hypothetical protein